MNVEPVAAVFGDEAVDQRHLGTQIDEPPRQVRADKAQPAGNQDSRPEKRPVSSCAALPCDSGPAERGDFHSQAARDLPIRLTLKLTLRGRRTLQHAAGQRPQSPQTDSQSVSGLAPSQFLTNDAFRFAGQFGKDRVRRGRPRAAGQVEGEAVLLVGSRRSPSRAASPASKTARRRETYSNRSFRPSRERTATRWTAARSALLEARGLFGRHSQRTTDVEVAQPKLGPIHGRQHRGELVFALVSVDDPRLELDGQHAKAQGLAQALKQPQIGPLRIAFEPVDAGHAGVLESLGQADAGDPDGSLDVEQAGETPMRQSSRLGSQPARAVRRAGQMELGVVTSSAAAAARNNMQSAIAGRLVMHGLHLPGCRDRRRYRSNMGPRPARPMGTPRGADFDQNGRLSLKFRSG